jgi:streptogramin lyase
MTTVRTVPFIASLIVWFLVNVTFPPCSSASETTGKVTEFALPAGNPGYPPMPDGIAAGADGNLWVAETGINKIARVTPAGTITEFPVKGGMLPSAVTAGPDGNLWFAQRGGVGYITPVGKVTIYKVDGIISSISPGSDGNLWFTENFRGKIGRVTPSGQITLFNVPTRPGGGSSNPLTIAAGPDGNLWFTESRPEANKIGRITTAGLFTEFSVPTAGSPRGIAAGPDGNLWFVHASTSAEDRVVKITPAGVITEYALSSLEDSRPVSIVSGPDGNLWFTESNNPNNKVARFTPTGELKEFQVPTGFSGPRGLAVGPDGNLWFTENGKAKVGRLQAAAADTRCVLHLASGFVPRTKTVAQGQSVEWINEMPGLSTVQQTSRPPIFDSSSQGTGSTYSVRFAVAGTYTYADHAHPSHKGTITVPMRVSPDKGTPTTSFVVTWATGSDPVVSNGWMIDVQVTTPGTKDFAAWQDGVTTKSAVYVPTAGNGTYRFRTRMRHAVEQSASDWSPIAPMSVH